MHDVGDSLSPLVDIGQIEGGFVQGVGWLTLEDLRWDESDGPGRGRLTTQSASTYKLPSFSELPDEFNVALLEHAHEDGVVYGSKAVGEPPLMLAFAVREALREAAGAFGPPGTSVDLASPATPEAVFWAIERARSAGSDHVVEGLPGAVPDRPDPTAPRSAPEVRAGRPLRGGGLTCTGSAPSSACGANATAGVLVTVADVRGHAPRDAGAKMVVAADGTWGSIGGGNLEETAVARARALLSGDAGAPEQLTLGLTDKTRTDHGRQCCGERSRCCSSRCRSCPRSRSSGSATSASSWPGSWCGTTSTCTSSTPAPPSSRDERLACLDDGLRRRTRPSLAGARARARARSRRARTCW